MCECRKLMNERLADKNARLAFGFTFGGGHMGLTPPIIETEKLKPRGKKPPIVLATFCPFCGVKYERAVEEIKS
jgi:hypothetical protein